MNNKQTTKIPNKKQTSIKQQSTKEEKEEKEEKEKKEKKEELQEDVRHRYKKTSIKNSNYERPPLTYTDLLTKEQIETLLIDFEEIKDISTIPIGTFIRYFENKDKELKFRVGGILTVKKPEEGYIYLKNNLVNWPVQINNCLLFRKITTNEIKKEYDKIILEKDKKINELTAFVRTLKLDIVKLKKELANYNK